MPSVDVFEHWSRSSRLLSEADFFAELPSCPFIFLYGEGRYLVLAEDPLDQRDERDEGRTFLFHRQGEIPPVLPDFLGHVCYEYGYALDPVWLGCFPGGPRPSDLPQNQHLIYRRIQVYDRIEQALYEGIRSCPRRLPLAQHALGKGAFRAQKIKDTDTAESYCAKVDRIREGIRKGDVYQVNLTRQEDWRVEGNLKAFAKSLWALNPAPRSALVAGADWTIISSSPEDFFQIDKGRLSTRPIKGTARRHADPVKDRALADDLLRCPKNRSELAMIVDLLRNDLARICTLPSVRVEAFPVLEHYANVHHLVADISGQWPSHHGLEDLFKALFPGGSITGCPKLAAMALIRELETVPRSIYTGALGWCRADMAQASYSIPIRTAWVKDGILKFGVGGGVVWDSDPMLEYEETLHKGRSLVACLEGRI